MENQTQSNAEIELLSFRLAEQEYSVDIMSVREIRGWTRATPLPHAPAYVRGVINLRGTVLPVIDQRSRLGMDGIARNDRQRIMVYTLGGQRTGFIVDSVAEVLRIGRHQIDAAPDLSDEQGRLITQVAKLDGDRRLVMLIDPAHLLGARELRSLVGVVPAAGLDDEPLPLAKAA